MGSLPGTSSRVLRGEEDPLRHRGRPAPNADCPEACREDPLLCPGRGPSGPVSRTVRAFIESTVRWFVPVFGIQKHFLVTVLGTMVFRPTKNRPPRWPVPKITPMSTTNIIKPTMEALPADD
jgi:hypothetical protein